MYMYIYIYDIFTYIERLISMANYTIYILSVLENVGEDFISRGILHHPNRQMIGHVVSSPCWNDWEIFVVSCSQIRIHVWYIYLHKRLIFMVN